MTHFCTALYLYLFGLQEDFHEVTAIYVTTMTILRANRILFIMLLGIYQNQWFEPNIIQNMRSKNLDLLLCMMVIRENRKMTSATLTLIAPLAVIIVCKFR